MTAVIKVADVLARILASRDIIQCLKTLILKAGIKCVDLDFKDVEFISRSAAHELLVLKENLSHKLFRKKLINFTNTRDNVSEVLRIVAASRAMPKPKQTECNIERAGSNFLYNLPSA